MTGGHHRPSRSRSSIPGNDYTRRSSTSTTMAQTTRHTFKLLLLPIVSFSSSFSSLHMVFQPTRGTQPGALGLLEPVGIPDSYW